MFTNGFGGISSDVELDAQGSLPLLQDRYILTSVGHQQLSFPSQWVSEILTVERSQILPLPHYHPLILGVTHHQGQIVPLISADAFLAEKTSRLARSSITEMLNIIRLSRATQHLSGVGVVVGQVLGSRSKEQLSLGETTLHSFDLHDIPKAIWQPQPGVFRSIQN